MGIASHPFFCVWLSAQQCFFQVREHGVQSLDAAGGGVPDIGMADEVNDLRALQIGICC